MNDVLGLCCENTLLPLSPSSGEPAGLTRCEARRPRRFSVFRGLSWHPRQFPPALFAASSLRNSAKLWFCFGFAMLVSNRWHGGAPMGSVVMRRIRRFLCGWDRPRPVSLMDCRKAFQRRPLLRRSKLRYKRGIRLRTVVYGTDSRKPECREKRPMAPSRRRCRDGPRSGIERGAAMMAAAARGMSSHAQCVCAFGVVPAMHEETSLRRRWPVEPRLSERRCWQARSEHEKGGRDSRSPSRQACSAVTDSSATARAIVHLPAFAVRLP